MTSTFGNLPFKQVSQIESSTALFIPVHSCQHCLLPISQFSLGTSITTGLQIDKAELSNVLMNIMP